MGLRLVLLGDIPSPWSEAARIIFDLKKIPFIPVRYRIDDDSVRQWTGVHNAPVAVYNDEPPLSHWADLLALAERLEKRVPLIPGDREERIAVLGHCHEIMGPMGLVWHTRLLLIHASLVTAGQCGFSVKVAEYLAKKYGYDADSINASRERVRESFDRLALQIAQKATLGREFLLSDRPTALDIYAASALGVLSPLPDDVCPLHPRIRRMLDSAAEHIGWAIPEELLAHREFVYRYCRKD